jgi:hypothetical protein
MACYKIWWLGGWLDKGDERYLYHSFGKTLAEVFHALAGVNEHFRRHYEFAWYERCTRKDFLSRWQDPLTAGMLLNAHADISHPSRPPLAYDHSIDGASTLDTNSLNKRRTEQRLLPAELKTSAPTVRILALLSCASSTLLEEWKKVVPRDTPIVTAHGVLSGSEDYGKETQGEINKWIWKRSLEAPDHQKAREYMHGKISWDGHQKWKKWFDRTKSPTVETATSSAWQFFKWLAQNGPAGAGGGKDSGGEECKTASRRVHGTRIAGPLGAGRGGSHSPPRRGPIGLT